MLTDVSASAPATNLYFIAIFLLHTLGYQTEHNTGFNVLSGSYLKGSYTADELSLGSVTTLSGSAAVMLPVNFYTASVSDVGRIVALKSSLYPRHNSGLFRVSSIDTGTNSLIIDYRSSEAAPAESSVRWRVFENETLVPAWSSGSNGKPGYATIGSGSTATRLTLSSPSGYAVRLALESLPDRSGTVPCGFTVAPGVGSVSGGDFNNESGHLHGPMWYNTTSSAYVGTAVGLSPRINGFEWTTGQWRVYMAGDDRTGTCVVFNRNVSFVTGGNGWLAFGYPEDEPSDAMLDRLAPIERLFVVGHGQTLPNLSWRSGYFNDGLMTGMAWSQFGRPIPCVVSCYAPLRNISHPRHSPAADDVMFSSVALLDAELLVGTMDTLVSPTATSSGTFSFEPRRLGRFPIARMGRANVTSWSLGTAVSSTETWLHTKDGIYIPWGGPLLSGTLSSGSLSIWPYSSSSLSSGEGLDDSNVPNEPGSDPEQPEISQAVETGGIDATRFQKTYSFFRQPAVTVGVVKAGSNVSKP